MKLITLTLDNFQGVTHAEFDFSGQSCSIYGDNATGKTTVFNAFTWLLFDKASTGAKNFSPKTTGTHELDYSASAVIQADDGSQVGLRKVFHEVYKKKRGSAEREFSGHTTDYFIDGVPTPAGDFKAKIQTMVGDEEQLKMLTMPDYFPEKLAWQDRRKILLDICGDVSDLDVIHHTKELVDAKFEQMLQVPGADRSYTVDEFRKITMATRKKINTELDTVPERIDEAQKAIPDTDGMSLEDLKAKKDSIEGEINTLDMEQRMQTTDATSEIMTQISNARAELAESRNAYAASVAKENEGKTSQLRQMQEQIREKQKQAFELRGSISQIDFDINSMEQKRESLISEYKEEASKVWNDDDAVCPTCHRPYDPDKVDEMHQAFNLRRSQHLEDINRRGKACSKTAIQELKDKASEELKKLGKLTSEIKQIQDTVTELSRALTEVPDFTTTKEYLAISARIISLQNSMADSSQASQKASWDRMQAIAQKKAQLEAIESKIASFTVKERQEKRIEELKASQRTLAEAFEEAEYRIHLCDVFTKAKVSLLDQRINSRFKTLRFKLFEEQLNGGVTDCCEVMIPSPDGRMVQYAFANNASKINAGLEIIHTLSTAWNLWIPVMVDNAESVTHLMEYPDMQVIRLVVSENDKHLRMEHDAA